MVNVFNKDFLDFLHSLNNNKVAYLLVGGYAVILHGYSRTTGDLDIWVKRTKENYECLLSAFKEFGMPVFDMTEENFLFHEEWDVFQFGPNPSAIGIMTKMGDLHFDSCFDMANLYPVEGVEIKLVHYTHLIKAKQAAGRFKDLNDLENLPKQI